MQRLFALKKTFCTPLFLPKYHLYNEQIVCCMNLYALHMIRVKNTLAVIVSALAGVWKEFNKIDYFTAVYTVGRLKQVLSLQLSTQPYKLPQPKPQQGHEIMKMATFGPSSFCSLAPLGPSITTSDHTNLTNLSSSRL